MARGRTVGELITDLRAETGRSMEPAHGLNDHDRLIAIIRRAYNDCYDAFDWPHLKVTSVKAMAAGQRYYDFPTTIDPERVTGAWLKEGGEYNPEHLPYGIDPGLYSEFDSDADVRSDPVLRWDFYNDGTNVQFEAWPLPASANCSIKFEGIKKRATLTDEAHIVDIDDAPVLAFAKAYLAPAKDREDMFRLALASLNRIKGRLDKTESFVRGGRLGSGEGMSRTDRRFAYVRS